MDLSASQVVASYEIWPLLQKHYKFFNDQLSEAKIVLHADPKQNSFIKGKHLDTNLQGKTHIQCLDTKENFALWDDLIKDYGVPRQTNYIEFEVKPSEIILAKAHLYFVSQGD